MVGLDGRIVATTKMEDCWPLAADCMERERKSDERGKRRVDSVARTCSWCDPGMAQVPPLAHPPLVAPSSTEISNQGCAAAQVAQRQALPPRPPKGTCPWYWRPRCSNLPVMGHCLGSAPCSQPPECQMPDPHRA